MTWGVAHQSLHGSPPTFVYINYIVSNKSVPITASGCERPSNVIRNTSSRSFSPRRRGEVGDIFSEKTQYNRKMWSGSCGNRIRSSPSRTVDGTRPAAVRIVSDEVKVPTSISCARAQTALTVVLLAPVSTTKFVDRMNPPCRSAISAVTAARRKRRTGPFGSGIRIAQVMGT